MKHLEDILEEIKQLGNYSVVTFYGGDIGCDDLGVPQDKRVIKIFMVPVGVLGSARIMWKGDLLSLREFDFTTRPKVVSNPPATDETQAHGYYTWGTEQGIEWLFKNWDERHTERKEK